MNNTWLLEYVSGSFLWNWWSPDEALKDLQILQDIPCLNNIIAITLVSGLFAKMMVYFGLARKKLNLLENAWAKKTLLWLIPKKTKSYTNRNMKWIGKGQLISKCPFGVIVSTKVVLRISAL